MNNISNIYASYIIIGINFIVFIIETAVGGSTTRTDVAIRLGAQTTSKLKSGQLYRLVTSMFVHFGVAHLAMNMDSLYAIGPTLELILGKTWFLIIYFVSGISGNLLTWKVESKTHKNTVSAGASGAIFGLLGVYLVVAILLKDQYSFPIRGIAITLAINIIYGLANKRINMSAHIGGLIGGVVTIFVLLLI